MITALVMRRGRSDRIAVYLDGSRAFDLALEVADKAGLHQGVALDAQQRERLVAADAPYRARERALRMLAVRDRCGREIETRLVSAGFDEALAKSTVAWLRDLGYVDEERFAVAFATERLKGGWGVRRISAELARKGVEKGAIEQALGGSGQGSAVADEGLAVVTALARRRFLKQFEADPAGAKRRMSAFLARRGYDWDDIGRVARILAEETEEGRPGGTDGSDGSEVE